MNCALCVLGPWLCAVGFGLWAFGSWLWALCSGRWALGSGRCVLGSVLWAMGAARWAVYVVAWPTPSSVASIKRADHSARGRAVAGAFAYPEMCAYQGAWGSGNGASILRATWTPSSRSTLRGRSRLCARSLRRKLPFMRSARTSWWPAPTTRRFFRRIRMSCLAV